MKIFYGVQGTGNGHITRARVMAKALAAAGMDVTYQFTGRPADKYFDMEIFNGYQLRDGLTFNTHNGKVSYLKTARDAKLITFIKDVKSLDLSGYDLILSDYEPITSWAAKQQKKTILGIGHQYAFRHNVPKKGHDPLADFVMNNFAPTERNVGLHWHHFGQPILPPIIDLSKHSKPAIKNKIVVYLPFEDQNEVIRHLASFENFNFHCYAPDVVRSEYAHIICHPLSRENFQKDLLDCVGVIGNAGFELSSEALQLGKKLLIKPLHKQMEQISNAAALQQLGYGHVMDDLDVAAIERWLDDVNAVQVTFPNVAEILVTWVQDGMPAMDADFFAEVWNKVDVLHIQHNGMNA